MTVLRLPGIPLLLLAWLFAAAAVHAQGLTVGGSGPQRDQPVFFTADEVEYDSNTGVVTARGHIEAWQGERVLRADTMTYDRNTGRMTAAGNIVLIEPDGQTMFAETADLTDEMRNGVLEGLRGLLADNGRLAANGARRTDGNVTEMARVVYSTCDLCREDPTRPPLWQLRARTARHDNDAKRISYRDVTMQLGGVPIFYMPALWHADPSVKRQSGLLIPTFGRSTDLGAFVSIPYYWVIDEQSDLTLAPMFSTKQNPLLGLDYRRRFNGGQLRAQGSVTYDKEDGSLKGHIFSSGMFAYDEVWRYGFGLNRATDDEYLRRFRISSERVLTTQAFIEGFGINGIEGAYARLDTRIYQGLRSSVDDDALIPFVVPRLYLDYAGPTGWRNSRLGLDAGFFALTRSSGTDTRRLAGRSSWQMPLRGMMGEQMTLAANLDLLAYQANDLDRSPNFYSVRDAGATRAHPQVSFTWSWPWARHGETMGSQVIEPIVQVVAGPNTGTGRNKRPNEDSLDLEFTDANLFGFNKFPGRDMLEGGLRANVGLRGSWYLGGTIVDSLIGQSYRVHKDDTFAQGSGLEDKASDIVARVTFMPTPWMDLTWRGRFDDSTGTRRLMDTVASVGPDEFRASFGYLFTAPSPYLTPYQERSEISLGFSSRVGNWRVAGAARRDIETRHMVQSDFLIGYEDECFIFDIRYQRRFTVIDTDREDDRGDTALLFRLVFKTVGEFGFNAL